MATNYQGSSLKISPNTVLKSDGNGDVELFHSHKVLLMNYANFGARAQKYLAAHTEQDADR